MDCLHCGGMPTNLCSKYAAQKRFDCVVPYLINVVASFSTSWATEEIFLVERTVQGLPLCTESLVYPVFSVRNVYVVRVAWQGKQRRKLRYAKIKRFSVRYLLSIRLWNFHGDSGWRPYRGRNLISTCQKRLSNEKVVSLFIVCTQYRKKDIVSPFPRPADDFTFNLIILDSSNPGPNWTVPLITACILSEGNGKAILNNFYAWSYLE